MRKGKIIYTPICVINELKDIMEEHKIPNYKGGQWEACKKMVEYARVGREMERIMKLDFKWKITKDR